MAGSHARRRGEFRAQSKGFTKIFVWHSSCEGISLYLEHLDHPHVLDFLISTHEALESCTRRWGLCDLWLQLSSPALEVLVAERFVEWEFIQRLRFIRVEGVSRCASLACT